MAPCGFCKAEFGNLKCTSCRKVSYCSKDCQTKDWKSHKPVCPPYRVGEVAGMRMGRGVFATRKIKPGMVIMEEMPLIILDLDDGKDLGSVDGLPEGAIISKLKSQIQIMDKSTKAAVLSLHDPVVNIRTLKYQSIDVDWAVEVSPNLRVWTGFDGNDDVSKMLRIFTCNSIIICPHREITSKTSEAGLYYVISLINHSCRPNAQFSWVKGDIKRKQVIAMRTIEKGQEISAYYIGNNFGSRDDRRDSLLEDFGMLCWCPECSLEGNALRENEKLRADIRKGQEKVKEMIRNLERNVSTQLAKKKVKSLLSLSQKVTVLVRKLDIPHELITHLLYTSLPVARQAAKWSVGGTQSPDEVKREARDLCQNAGDDSMFIFNNLATQQL